MYNARNNSYVLPDEKNVLLGTSNTHAAVLIAEFSGGHDPPALPCQD